MSSRSTLRIILTAMFAALICVATMFIRIPTPGTGGYANAGDGLMLTAAFLLPPGCAAIAAGVGSMLSDLLAGYMSYVPGTLVIKGAATLIAALICRRSFRFSRLTGAILCELFMVAGYLLYESLLLSYGAGALASMPANLAQGAVGVVIGMALTPFFTRSRDITELLKKME